MDGEMHTMNVIFAEPLNESLSTLVSFELLKGICVLFLSCSAEMQYPKVDKLELIDVSSWILMSFSCGDIFGGILNFSLPARSTILSFDIRGCLFDPFGYCTSVI